MAGPQPPSGETAARIRVAAQEAIKHIPGAMLGDGEINEIIRQTGSDQLNMAERLTRAASMATAIAEAHNAKPVNYSAASTEAVDRMRAAMGLSPLGRNNHLPIHLRERDAASGDRPAASSATYKGTLVGMGDPTFLRSLGLSDATAKGLAGLGFTSTEQVRQIAGDAKTLGLSPNAAAMDLGRLRKAEGDRTNEHVAALKKYGDGLRDLDAEQQEIKKIKDPKERAERQRAHDDKRRTKEEELKEHRDQKVKTPEGKKHFDKVRDRLRAKSHQRAELEGKQKAAFDDSQEKIAADIREIGGERIVEKAHADKLAMRSNDTGATDDVAARLARRAQPTNRTTETAEPPIGTVAGGTKAAPSETKSQEARSGTSVPQQPKTLDRRLAIHAKGLNPTV